MNGDKTHVEVKLHEGWDQARRNGDNWNHNLYTSGMSPFTKIHYYVPQASKIIFIPALVV